MAHVTDPPAVLRRLAVGVAGAMLAVAGLSVVLLAQAAMGSSWRIGVDPTERTALVTTGIFGRVRNPIFTGIVLMVAGVTLMVPTFASVLGLLCLVVAIEIKARAVEEPYLARVHGAAYTEYARRVGRFSPR